MILFSILAVLLVVAGITAMSRGRREMAEEDSHHGTTDAQRRARKSKRAQSKQARRQRHH